MRPVKRQFGNKTVNIDWVRNVRFREKDGDVCWYLEADYAPAYAVFCKKADPAGFAAVEKWLAEVARTGNLY